MQPTTIIPRDQVANHFTVAQTLLVRYEARGLIHAVRQGDIEGYSPSEIRRLWTIISLQRDLGVNLSGVEAILKLRNHLDEVHHRLHTLAGALREALEDDDLEPRGDG